MSCPNWYDTWIEDKHLNRTCTCNDHEYFDNGMSNFKKLRENIASKYTEKFNEVVSSFSTIKISIP